MCCAAQLRRARVAAHRPRAPIAVARTGDLRRRQSLARAMADRAGPDYCAHVPALRAIRGRHADAVIAGAIALLFAVEIATEGDFGQHRALSVAAALAFSATLVVRRSMPLVPLAAAIGLIELSNYADRPLGDAGAFMFGIVL